MNVVMPSRLMSSREVADVLSVDVQTVRRLAAEGVLKPVRFQPRSRLRFRRGDIESLISAENLPADPGAPVRGVVDERVEERIAAISATNSEPASPHMTVEEAAAYLRCSRQRIYDLLSARRLKRHKDGSRTLVRRDELDEYIERSSGR